MPSKTEYKPPEIVKEEIIIVDSWSPNEYGDIIILDKEGNAHKVKEKRKEIVANLQADTQYKLKYAEYMKHLYIADIECLEHPDIEKPAPKPEAVKSAATAVKPAPETGRQDSIERQTALKEVGECIRAGIEVNAGLKTAYWLYLMSRLDVTEEVTHATKQVTSDYTPEMLGKILNDAGWSQIQTANCLELNYQIPKQRNVMNMFNKLADEQKRDFLEYVKNNAKEEA